MTKCQPETEQSRWGSDSKEPCGLLPWLMQVMSLSVD